MALSINEEYARRLNFGILRRHTAFPEGAAAFVNNAMEG